MTEHLRILTPPSTGTFGSPLSRRHFLGLAAAAGLLAACGDGGATGASSVQGPSAAASKAAAELESELNIYNWAQYTEPDNIAAFSKANDVKVTQDIYDSNEGLIAKLSLAGGTSGYDLVIPSGVFIPQMVSKNLLKPLDLSKIPRLSNIDKAYLDQPWDKGNKYSVCKDFGTTGIVYNPAIVTTAPKSWSDVLTMIQSDALSGKVSILDDPLEVTAIWFWANDIDPNTATDADFTACQDFMTSKIAPSVKKFDAYPSEAIVAGNYALSHAYNGDARSAILEDDTLKWVAPTPHTNLWMDNYTIPSGAKHPEAAHAFINYMLTPDVSAREVSYHGYNTGIDETKKILGEKLKQPQIIYPDEGEVDRFVPVVVNENQPKSVRVLDAMKAKAGA